MTNGANRLATVLTVVGIVVPIVVTVIGAAVVLNRSIGRVEGEVGGLQDRFDDFGRQLATFDEITRRIDPQVAVLEAQVAAFTPGVTRLSDGVTRFDRTIGTLEGSLNELRMEHGRIISELANIREIQRAMQAPLDRTVRYVAPEGSEPLPPGFYQDVTARLRRIEERLNAVAERIRGAGG